MTYSKGLVKLGSQIVADTGIVLLIDTYINNTEKEKCEIFVPSVHVKNFFDETHISKLRNYFDKNVVIIINNTIIEEAKKAEQEKRGSENKQALHAKENSIKDNIIAEGKLLGQDYLFGEYLTTPFFVGSSNQLAVSMRDSFISKKNPPMYMVYGPSGTGKSHLLQRTAYELKKQGKNIYLNSTKQFIDDVKLTYRKDQRSIREIIMPAEYFILDDIQSINFKHLEFIHESLFDAVNYMIERDKKVMFAADRNPTVLTELADRIVSRFGMGYTAELELPGSDIKTQYLEFKLGTEGIELSEEERDIIINNSASLRELIGQMTFVISAKRSGTLDIRQISSKSQIYTKPAAVGPGIIEGQYREIYTLLREYYAIPAMGTEGQRKSRGTAKMISILVYMFNGKINKNALQERLHLDSKLYIYYKKKGKEQYSSLPPELRRSLEGITK